MQKINFNPTTVSPTFKSENIKTTNKGISGTTFNAQLKSENRKTL